MQVSTMLTNFNNENLQPQVDLVDGNTDNPIFRVTFRTEHYEIGNSTVSEIVMFLQLKTAEELERYLSWATASYYVEKQVREELAQKRLENNNA